MTLLLRSLLVENAYSEGQRYVKSVSGDYTIRNSVISHVDNDQRGGAAFFDCGTANIKLYNVLFYMCSTTFYSSSAGGISIFNADTVEFTHLCFHKCCSQSDATSFQICTYAYTVKKTSYNHSVEAETNRGKYVSLYGSHIGGTERVYSYYNNNSRNCMPSKNEFAMVFAKSNNIIVRFFNIESGSSTNVLRTHYPDVVLHFLNWVVVNNTASALHLFSGPADQSTRYEECIFEKNKITEITSGSGVLYFKNNIFDTDYSMKVFVSEGINLFMTTTAIQLKLSTGQCINSLKPENLCQTYPKPSSFYITTILLNLINE